jgi:serine/threonine protein kinase
MHEVQHTNIVRYLGTEHIDTTLSIFMEYAPGGSLRSLIQRCGRLDELTIQSYTRMLLLGLQCLHDNGIAHR